MSFRRKSEWGNWGLTFYKEYEDGKIEVTGKLYFPVGPQGPIDGFVGSPERMRYSRMCQEWGELGVLPEAVEVAQ